MTEHTWTAEINGNVQKRTPYDQCPHCGERQLITRRDFKTTGPLFFGELVETRRWTQCRNCQYNPDKHGDGTRD